MLSDDVMKILQSPKFKDWYLKAYRRDDMEDIAMDIFLATPSPISDELTSGQFGFRREWAVAALERVCAEYLQENPNDWYISPSY